MYDDCRVGRVMFKILCIDTIRSIKSGFKHIEQQTLADLRQFQKDFPESLNHNISQYKIIRVQGPSWSSHHIYTFQFTATNDGMKLCFLGL